MSQPAEQPNDDELQEAADEVEEHLEEALRNIDMRDEAEAVVEEIARDVGDRPAIDVAEEKASELEGVPAERQAEVVADAMQTAVEEKESDVEEAAAALEEVAKDAAALDGPAYEAVNDAVQAVTGPSAGRPEDLERPRRFLLDALLEQPGVSRLQKYDTELFLFLNNKFPRNVATDTFFTQLSFWFSGGWAWLIGTALFWPFRRERTTSVLKQIALPIWMASLVVEGPIKKYFRRRRPFIDLVRAVVVGKKPGNWSFPSGHSAGAFAGAQMLGRCVPRLRGLWYAIAGLVGFSRIYLGAHYPADVLSGSLMGIGLAEITRWLMQRLSSALR